MRGRRERIECSSHRDFIAARDVDQRHIDGDSQIVTAARGDIAVAEEIRAVVLLRPRHHCLTRAHWTIRVEDLYRVAVAVEIFVGKRQRGRRFIPKIGVLSLVPG
jgi:hypothetical protein